MDQTDLYSKIETRLEKTDDKIDRNNEKLDDLKDDLHNYNVKTAILETQMSGIVKFILLLAAAAIGIVGFLIKKGLT